MEYTETDALLHAWIHMSVTIRGNRLLKDLTFNEMVVCHFVNDAEKSGNGPATATDLCEQLHLLKSQVNRIVSGLEEKGLLRREASRQDRRKVYLYLRHDNLNVFLKEHEQILQLVDHVIRKMGVERAKQLTEMLTEMTGYVLSYESEVFGYNPGIKKGLPSDEADS